jgi:hypothetical protein
MYKTNCRVCNHTQLQKVLDLGSSPLANNLLNTADEIAELFPLELMYCDNCHNCQLSYTVEAGKMFDHYLYVSSTAKSFRDHFTNAANQYITDFKLTADSLIIDIGSNDGIALKPFKEKGFKVLGIEPAKNIAELANSNDIETYNEYFTQQVADKIKQKASIITASNVFAHADGLEEIAHAAMSVLKEDGHFIIEVQYLLDTIKDLTFDNIYHEHVNYWCVTSINNFFNRLGYKVVKVEHVDTHGGSIRVYVKHNNNEPDSSVQYFLEKENQFGLTNISVYKLFAQNVLNAKLTFLENIKKIKDQNQTIVGYGSPAKATTTLNYFGITNKDIDYILEDNVLKHNKFLPGIMIPIYSREMVSNQLPDNILIMAWNFAKEIIANNQELVDKNVNFINIKDIQFHTI